jgi:hypothetical protein
LDNHSLSQPKASHKNILFFSTISSYPLINGHSLESDKRKARSYLSRCYEKEGFINKYVLFVSVILLFLAAQIDAQTQIPLKEKVFDFPEVPRVSAYEAYIKYKADKAIIIQAGGEDYRKRHLMRVLKRA